MKIFSNLPISDEHKFILNRRIKKLKRDPKGFFKGSYEKRSQQIARKSPIKYSGYNDYTVVSAVYNVGDYLDDYFVSLTNQSLSFKKHIQLVLVDDGSTDNSAEIIKKWQRKYPNNITYLYKKNGGIASARNLGLNSVKTEWVTFIDSDDFVSNNYFKAVDDIIFNNKSIEMVVGNLKYYYEDNKAIKDNHPLNYRFDKKVNKVSLSNMGNNINLFVTVTFFKTRYLKEENICFDENIKPNFEDGKFIADYLLRVNTGDVFFLREAVFFYRKRGDGSSTIDNSWVNKGKFDDVLRFGYIQMLENYKRRYVDIPKNIQWTVIYELSWHIKKFLNQDEKLYFLSKNEKNLYYDLVKKAFSYIDSKYIISFNLNNFWYLYKVGVLGAFKHSKPPFQISYIENIDIVKKQLLVSYCTYFDISCSYRIDDGDIIPNHIKTTNHTFADELFVYEKRAWICFEDENSLFSLILDGMPSRITLKGKQHHDGILIKDILKAYQPSLKYATDDSWVFIDRDTQADDNAEHMYRYMMINHPEQKIYFALRQGSHDWARLKSEGFNLIDFGTEDFEYHLRKASKIISSHLDKYVNNYFGDEYEYSKDYVFLQHGVIMNDLSSWFRSKNNIQCFITSTKPEYLSLVANNNSYKLSEKEVVLTGLPRHDNLLNYELADSNIILVMPTWRQSITGNVIGDGNTRAINKKFMETDYAQHWYSFLHNSRLAQLVKDYNYKIIFAPHANIEPYLSVFDVPCYIDVWQTATAKTSMQQLFQKSKLMITDYSSVAFEMGMLNKAVLYYQFDHEELFSGGHITKRGYFAYEDDGFGPVVTEEGVLLIELQKILENNGEPSEPYLTRMQETFAYRDTNNCKRVYEAILDLDRPDTSVTSVEKIMEYAEKAITHEAWDLALERIENALQHSDITQAQVKEITQIKESVLQTGYQNKPIKLSNILWQEGRVEEALDALKQIDDIEASEELLRLRVKLAILNNDFVLARDSQKLLLENYNEQCTTEDWQFYTQLASI